jgi:hypothetical protein
LSFDHLLPGVIADYYEIDEHVNPVEYWKYSAESSLSPQVREAKCAKVAKKKQNPNRVNLEEPVHEKNRGRKV